MPVIISNYDLRIWKAKTVYLLDKLLAIAISFYVLFFSYNVAGQSMSGIASQNIIPVPGCEDLARSISGVQNKEELDDIIYAFLASKIHSGEAVDWNCIDQTVKQASDHSGVTIIKTSTGVVYRIKYYVGNKLYSLAPGASNVHATTIVKNEDGNYSIISRGGKKRWLK